MRNEGNLLLLDIVNQCSGDGAEIIRPTPEGFWAEWDLAYAFTNSPLSAFSISARVFAMP